MKFLLLIFPIAASVLAEGAAVEPSAQDPVDGRETVHGCYKSLGELQLNGTNAFNTYGACSQACGGLGASVAAVQASSCYCGDKYPPASALVDDSKCTEACPGFATQACGGLGTYTVINTGLKEEVGTSDDSSSSEASAAPSSTSAAAVVTISGTVVTTTATSQDSAASVTGSGATGTTPSGSSVETSGSTTASSSPTTVGASSAASQLAVSLSIAVLGLGTALLM